jgi:hypothetical protein
MPSDPKMLSVPLELKPLAIDLDGTPGHSDRLVERYDEDAEDASRVPVG